jgi:hypothetical protein
MTGGNITTLDPIAPDEEKQFGASQLSIKRLDFYEGGGGTVRPGRCRGRLNGVAVPIKAPPLAENGCIAAKSAIPFHPAPPIVGEFAD